MKISIDDEIDRLFDSITSRGKRLILSVICDSDKSDWKRFRGFDRKTYDELSERIKDLGFIPEKR